MYGNYFAPGVNLPMFGQLNFKNLYVVELLHANLNCHLFAKHLSIGLMGTAEHA